MQVCITQMHLCLWCIDCVLCDGSWEELRWGCAAYDCSASFYCTCQFTCWPDFLFNSLSARHLLWLVKLVSGTTWFMNLLIENEQINNIVFITDAFPVCSERSWMVECRNVQCVCLYLTIKMVMEEEGRDAWRRRWAWEAGESEIQKIWA